MSTARDLSTDCSQTAVRGGHDDSSVRPRPLRDDVSGGGRPHRQHQPRPRCQQPETCLRTVHKRLFGVDTMTVPYALGRYATMCLVADVPIDSTSPAHDVNSPRPVYGLFTNGCSGWTR